MVFGFFVVRGWASWKFKVVNVVFVGRFWLLFGYLLLCINYLKIKWFDIIVILCFFDFEGWLGLVRWVFCFLMLVEWSSFGVLFGWRVCRWFIYVVCVFAGIIGRLVLFGLLGWLGFFFYFYGVLGFLFIYVIFLYGFFYRGVILFVTI